MALFVVIISNNFDYKNYDFHLTVYQSSNFCNYASVTITDYLDVA